MAKKAIKKKRAYKKRAAPEISGADADTFEIETAPPPAVRGADPAKLKFLEKLQRTVDRVQPGQAFIIPASSRNYAERFLKAEVTAYRFSFFVIPDNKEALRVYKLEWAQPKTKK